MQRLLTRLLGPKWRRRILLIGGLLVFAWVMFFDSHSLLKRWQLHHQNQVLTAENERLETQINQVQDELKDVTSDETVERVAREEYGMRKEGETVHRVVETDK